jgi:hypothetical protein
MIFVVGAESNRLVGRVALGFGGHLARGSNELKFLIILSEKRVESEGRITSKVSHLWRMSSSTKI